MSRLSEAVSKAQTTKQQIIQKAAVVFNQQGYAGTSMTDIMQVTGLKKGGIYNHFSSKDDLALAAFDFAIRSIMEQYKTALQGKRHSISRLKAVIETFCTLIPTVKGGCPLMNMAVESNDTHPALCDRTRKAMDTWRQMLEKIINLGIKHQELQSSLDAARVTTILISTLEGALMLSQLYQDTSHIGWAKQHLLDYLETLRRT